MRQALDEDASSASLATQTDLARRARDGELERSWLAAHEYRQMLVIYRSWREEARAPTEPFGKAFNKRRDDAERWHLGPLEQLDL